MDSSTTTATRVARGAVPLLLAALLACAAVVTVDQAGCDHPGRYVTTETGVELVGGCVVPGAVSPSGSGHSEADRG